MERGEFANFQNEADARPSTLVTRAEGFMAAEHWPTEDGGARAHGSHLCRTLVSFGHHTQPSSV